jgi:hypothetical protein
LLDGEPDQVNTVFQNYSTHCSKQTDENAATDEESFGIRILLHESVMRSRPRLVAIEITHFF